MKAHYEKSQYEMSTMKRVNMKQFSEVFDIIAQNKKQCLLYLKLTFLSFF